MKAATQPLCPCCHGKLRKETRTVWVGQQVAQQGITLRQVTERPTSREECAALTNGIVTAVRWRTKTPPVISMFFEWDGVSYRDTAMFFCSAPCAEMFAVAAHAMGFRLKNPIPRG